MKQRRPEARKTLAARGAELVLVALLTSCFATNAVAAYLYRFTNAQGEVEISHSIPNDRVAHGYDVIDTSGRVVRRVAPQLTEEQINARREREEALARCQEAYNRVQRLYQYDSEIVQQKEKALEALGIAIENDEANLAHARSQHAELLSQAAQMERSGNQLTGVLLGNIERAAAQVKNLEISVKGRAEERLAIEERFEEERRILRDGC